MENLDKKEISNIIKKFSGKDDDGISKSLVTLQTIALDETEENHTQLALYASPSSFHDIKVVEGRIMLDINFDNGESEDCLALIDNMELYKVLLSQTEAEILNNITLILNDQYKSEQVSFSNPIYFEKFSNRAGKKINGVRFLYDPASVVYIPEFLEFETEEELDRMAEELSLETEE